MNQNLITEEELANNKKEINRNFWIEGRQHATILFAFNSKESMIDFSIILSSISHENSIISLRTDLEKIELLITIYSSVEELKFLERKITKLYKSYSI